MMTPEGRIKIMDFGLAKVRGKADLTAVGSTLGTLAYMSPEQARGETVHESTDIYSFGAVLFELLTGKRPFEGEYDHAVLYAILNQDPPVVSDLRKDISPSLASVVSRCLQKDPADRYQSFTEVRAALRNVLAGSSEEEKPGTFAFRLSKKQTLITAIGGFVLLLAAVLFMTGVGDRLAESLFPGSVPEQKHLVILPLTNVGGDPSRQSFCDGLMESMTSQITQFQRFHGAFWVVPAREVRRNDIKSPSDARAAFGANVVIDGSLQSIDQRYRLTLNLVDAQTLRQLNSSVIDIDRAEVASLHDESVIRLLTMLHLELQPQMRSLLQAGGTSVPLAYELYLQGRGSLLRYERTENIDAAITLFQQALREDSSYALASSALGEAYWRKYESGKDVRWVEKAVTQCERARMLDPELTPVNVTLGIVYAGTGRYEQARTSFEQALRTDPSNPEAFRGLAKVFEDQGNLSDAEQMYIKSVQLRPDYWGGYNDLGVFLYRNNRYNEAITQFQKVTELTPDNYRGYANLGGIQYLLERWPEARRLFELSFKIKKTYQVASNLGTLYYVEGRYSDAARMYEEALKFNVRDHLVWGNLANAYYWAPGEREKAAATFEKAIQLGEEQRNVNPSNAEIHALLAGYHAMIGKEKTATVLIRKALNLNPSDAYVMFRAGTVFEQLGNREKAIEYIQKALEAGYSRSEIAHQPELKALYDDPRYQKLLKQ